MGYIYRIYHIESGRSYIGQTIFPLDTRFRQHIYNAHTKTSASYNQHIKRAIRKYGVDAFAIEEIEQCDNSLLDEREKYWISRYDSVRHGYNMTFGGEGKVEHDSKKILEAWNDGLNMTEISERFGICWKSVSNHLKTKGVTEEEIRNRRYSTAMTKRKRAVYQYDADGNYIGEYPSIPDYEREHGCSTIYNAVDKGKLAAGCLWSYTKSDHIAPYHNRVEKAVYQYAKDGSYIRPFRSVVDAAREIGVRPSSITDVICGFRKSCHGYLWSHEKVSNLLTLNNINA